jgi:hypothetical protein
MDTVFGNRPQHPLPIIGVDDITPVVHALPVVKRGAPSIPALKESAVTNFYEPYPVRPNTRVSGVDLNNLKLLGQSSRDAWAQNKVELLRRAVRQTVEAMASMSLTGTLSWPVQLEHGGWETYQVEFGSLVSVTPDKLWTADGVKIVDVWETLSAQQEALQELGYGGTVEIWAGKTAYNALFKVAEDSKTTAKIRVEISDQGINIGGYLVKRRAEKYRNPQSGAMTDVVGPKVCKMIALDAGHMLPYCAIDDLDGNLQPLPFFVKPVQRDDPSGYMLIAESKPFPVPNVKGICDATVTS